MLKKNQGKEDVHSASSGSSEGRGSSLGWGEPTDYWQRLPHEDRLDFTRVNNNQVKALSFDLGNLYSRQARTYFPPEVDLPFRSGHEDEDEARSDAQSETSVYPFVAADYLSKERTIIFRLCFIALILELVCYPIFQTIITNQSYRLMGLPCEISIVLSVLTAGFFDTLANFIAGADPCAPLDTAINLSEKHDLPILMSVLLRVSHLASLFSFLFGASGSMLGLVWGISLVSSVTSNPTLYTILLVSSAVATIPAGVAYYTVFNIKKFISSFAAFIDYYYAKKNDLSIFKARFWVFMLESLNVIAFRSISFGAISLQLVDLFYGADAPQYLSLPVFFAAFFTTAWSVFSTRTLDVFNRWSRLHTLLPAFEEAESAVDPLSWSDYLYQLLVNRNVLTGLCSSLGLALLLQDLLGIDSALGIGVVCLLPVLMLLTYLRAQHDLVLIDHVIGKKIESEQNKKYWDDLIEQLKGSRTVERRIGQAQIELILPDQTASSDDDAIEVSAKKLCREATALINASFQEQYTDTLIKRMICAIAVLQVVGARGPAFLTFTENVAVATGIHLNTLAVFLLTAAVNMFNWFDMFSFGMTETFYSWRASSYILYAEETRGQKNPPTYVSWLRKNIFKYRLEIFTQDTTERGVLSVRYALFRAYAARPVEEEFSDASTEVRGLGSIENV